MDTDSDSDVGHVPMESHLIACVQEYLCLNLTENSIFLCERLVAQFPSEKNIFLLATCYHRAGQIYRAYHLLKGLGSDSCRYLFAVCCVELSKYMEAEAALAPNNDSERVPNGAAGMYLLGKIYQLSNRHTAAITNFRVALEMDPMLWCAFEELCALGADVEAEHYLQMKCESVNKRNKDSQAEFDMTTPTWKTPTVPMTVVEGEDEVGGSLEQDAAKVRDALVGAGMMYDSMSGLATTHEATPTLTSVTPQLGDVVFDTPDAPAQVSQPPPVKKVVKQTSKQQEQVLGSPTLFTHQSGFLSGRKFLDEGTMRKISSKLFSEPASALKIVQSFNENRNGEGATPDIIPHSVVDSKAKRSMEGQNACIPLLQLLGEGYRLLCSYRCEEAIEAFSRIPFPHYSTGWVLQAIGQAYYEMVDYPAAEKIFQQVRLIDPCRLQGLEIYSTVLWHMKKEVELSNLAQEAVALDRLSPISWCVMGNCFSLQKEHENALRFFQRALQLDPTFPYAYTLCGHEYFANEDFEKGLTCYRGAIRLNPRHYNAWFGSGLIYYRQEKYGMAEYHFRRAHHINRRSSVLKCYLGMALFKVKRTGEALQALRQAVQSDPRNPLARFEYATVLASMGSLQNAVKELTILHNIAPKEASVLFQKGKILKKLGQIDEALSCFWQALDLQPPSMDTNLIKAAIDRIGVADADDEEEM